jgi:hypothetical protein
MMRAMIRYPKKSRTIMAGMAMGNSRMNQGLVRFIQFISFVFYILHWSLITDHCPLPLGRNHITAWDFVQAPRFGLKFCGFLPIN